MKQHKTEKQFVVFRVRGVVAWITTDWMDHRHVIIELVGALHLMIQTILEHGMYFVNSRKLDYGTLFCFLFMDFDTGWPICFRL